MPSTTSIDRTTSGCRRPSFWWADLPSDSGPSSLDRAKTGSLHPIRKINGWIIISPSTRTLESPQIELHTILRHLISSHRAVARTQFRTLQLYTILSGRSATKILQAGALIFSILQLSLFGITLVSSQSLVYTSPDPRLRGTSRTHFHSNT